MINCWPTGGKGGCAPGGAFRSAGRGGTGRCHHPPPARTEDGEPLALLDRGASRCARAQALLMPGARAAAPGHRHHDDGRQRVAPVRRDAGLGGAHAVQWWARATWCRLTAGARHHHRCSNVDLPVAACLAIEDSAPGIAAAVAAGVPVLRVRGRFGAAAGARHRRGPATAEGPDVDVLAAAMHAGRASHRADHARSNERTTCCTATGVVSLATDRRPHQRLLQRARSPGGVARREVPAGRRHDHQVQSAMRHARCAASGQRAAGLHQLTPSASAAAAGTQKGLSGAQHRAQRLPSSAVPAPAPAAASACEHRFRRAGDRYPATSGMAAPPGGPARRSPPPRRPAAAPCSRCRRRACRAPAGSGAPRRVRTAARRPARRG